MAMSTERATNQGSCEPVTKVRRRGSSKVPSGSPGRHIPVPSEAATPSPARGEGVGRGRAPAAANQPRRCASTLQGPGPAAEKKSQMKQKRKAGSPLLRVG